MVVAGQETIDLRATPPQTQNTSVEIEAGAASVALIELSHARLDGPGDSFDLGISLWNHSPSRWS